MPDALELDDPDRRDLIERLALVLAESGFPPMPARVWSAMITADSETCTAGDLGDRLGVSPAAISGALRYLLQVGLIERAPAPGGRRLHYRLPKDLWVTALMAERRGLARFAAVAAEGVVALGPGSRAADRLEDIAGFFRYVADAMPRLLEEWRSSRPPGG